MYSESPKKMSFRKAIEFVHSDNRYKCMKCDEILHDPVQSLCGHRFCFSCWEAIFKRDASEQRCPRDGESLQREHVFRDKCAQKELLAMECFCCNKARGCHWRGPLAKLQSHDTECPLSEVKCLNSSFGCNVVVVRCQLKEHLEKECVVKVVDCPSCQPAGRPEVMIPQHLKECGEFPDEYPHGCDEDEIPREKLPDHVKSCPKVPVQCGFSSMGCDFHGQVQSLDEHNSSHTAKHSTFSNKFIKEIVELKLKDVQVQLNEFRKLNQIYEARLTLLNEALAQQNQMLCTHQLKQARLEENLKAQWLVIHELRGVIETMINSQGHAGRNSQEMMRRLELQDERLASLAYEEMPLGDGRQTSSNHPQPFAQAEQASLASARGSDTSDHRFPEPVEHAHALTVQELQLADQHLALQNLENTPHHGLFLEPFTLR